MKYLKMYETFNNDNFDNWFGYSKIIDDNGNPIIMYHGSSVSRKFSVFNDNKPIWFTRNKSYAEAFIDKRNSKGVVFEVYLKIEKPIYVGDIDGISNQKKLTKLSELTNIDINKLNDILNSTNGVNLFEITNSEEFKEIMIGRGYDGIEAKEGMTTSFAVFNSNQIKSTKNKGTYDINNKNIMK